MAFWAMTGSRRNSQKTLQLTPFCQTSSAARGTVHPIACQSLWSAVFEAHKEHHPAGPDHPRASNSGHDADGIVQMVLEARVPRSKLRARGPFGPPTRHEGACQKESLSGLFADKITDALGGLAHLASIT